jgi:hypothetical protein
MLRHLLILVFALQLAIAPMARAGVTSTVTGADFGDAFRGSFISSVVALGRNRPVVTACLMAG